MAFLFKDLCVENNDQREQIPILMIPIMFLYVKMMTKRPWPHAFTVLVHINSIHIPTIFVPYCLFI
jgi:hypothetical protein